MSEWVLVRVIHDELLPCPFCGGSDIDREGWASNDGRRGPVCDSCGASADSEAGWNRRAFYSTARPPMPRAEWDAMVERACEMAVYRESLGHSDPPLWDDYEPDLKASMREDMRHVLRAALPGLQVEGE